MKVDANPEVITIVREEHEALLDALSGLYSAVVGGHIRRDSTRKDTVRGYSALGMAEATLKAYHPEWSDDSESDKS